VQLIVPPVLARIDSEQFRSAVLAELPAGVPTDPVTFVAEQEPGTGILTLSAESAEKGVTQEAASAAAAHLERNPVSELVRTRLLNRATDPESASTSRRIAIMVGVTVLALVLAVFAAIGAQTMRPRPAGAASVSEEFGVGVIGEIPFRRRLPRSSRELFDREGPLDIREAFQKLAINFELLLDRRSTIAVTSWGDGEGKTLVTANLAWALSSLSRQVTAVDCDLRRPGLHRSLVVRPDNGVTEISRGAPVARATRPVASSTLNLISAGKADVRQPIEVIGDALSPILEANVQRVVVIDTPPLFCAETALIATQVDAVVLVIDAQRREPNEIRNALRELELARASLLGVVLNRAHVSARRQSRYYTRDEL
jgi:Mrp family chromosome partitioning ATPase